MKTRMTAIRGPLRDLPPASTRVRGAGDAPYNPKRPLRLPHEAGSRNRQLPRLSPLGRALVLVVVLTGLGVGVFFLASALIGDGEGDALAADASAEGTSGPGAALDEGTGLTAVEEPAGTTGEPASGPDLAETLTEGAVDPTAPTSTLPEIITPVDLGGAPVLIDRGGATPIPSTDSDQTLSDGTPYDPSDPTVAFSSVWAVGTVLEITRLPGGPLLSAEEAAALIGKTIEVTVVDTGAFPTEIQLSPAAYRNLALPIEPIIALRLQVIDAPEGTVVLPGEALPGEALPSDEAADAGETNG